ncbi:MAG: hypothetical protein H7Y33_14380 [Cytophagales bacterium]|nr:hypothetical protein [Rhizobacter sp.]
MSSWVRSVFMWLLVAALPVQSWAAATMMNCGPSHHQRAESAQPHHPSTAARSEGGPSHAAHGHGGGHGEQHGGAQAAVSDHSPAEDAATPCEPHDSVQKLGKSKCSACASCCMATALPSAVLSFDAQITRDTAVPAMPHAIGLFLTSGLERPPRNILA